MNHLTCNHRNAALDADLTIEESQDYRCEECIDYNIQPGKEPDGITSFCKQVEAIMNRAKPIHTSN